MSKNCSYLVQNSDLPLILYNFFIQICDQLSKMRQKCGTAFKYASKMVDRFKKWFKNMPLQIFRTVSKYLKEGKHLN